MAVTRIKNNQITDSTILANAKLVDYSVTSAKLANNLTYNSSLTVAGNLTVQGNVTTIDTFDLVVEDPLILLAKDQASTPSLDIGFIGRRGSETNIAFVWDESADEFATVFTDDITTNTVITIASYASLKTLDHAVTGNLTVTGTSGLTGNVTLGNVFVDGEKTIDVGNSIISNLQYPSANTDAATKAYVDDVSASGFTIEDDAANTTVISGGNTLQLLGTANEVTVAITDVDQVTFGLPANVTVAGALSTATLTTSGDSLIGGNLVVQGNLTYINIDDLRVEDPIIVLGTGPNGAPLTADDGKDRGIFMEYYKTAVGNAFMGWDNSSGNMLIASNVSIANDVITVNSFGIVEAGGVYANNYVATFFVNTPTITGQPGLTLTTANANITLDAVGSGKVIVTELQGNALIYTDSDLGLSTSGNATWDGANLQITGVSRFDDVIIDGTDISAAAGEAELTINTGAADINFRVAGDNQGNLLLADAGTNTILVRTGTPVTGATVVVNSADSILLPVGNTAQRPGTPQTGMFRFNTSIDAIEFYGATEWESISSDFTVISVDEFNGDGSTVAFTLSQSTTTAGTIVCLNGVVQLPFTAYSVSGTTLTFTEAPGPADVIDARIITTTAIITSLENAVGNAAVTPAAGAAYINITGNLIPTTDDAFTLGNLTNRWSEGYFSNNSVYIGNIIIKEVGNALAVFELDGTTPANTALSQLQNGTTEVALAQNGNVTVTAAGNLVMTLTGSQVFTKGVTMDGTASAINVTASGNANAGIHTFTGNAASWFSDTGEDIAPRLTLAVGNSAGPIETVIINRSSDALAYSEFLAINDTGNISAGWCAIGMNSSAYNDPSFPVTKADDGYLLYAAPAGTSAAGNLVIGTGDTGNVNAIVFAAGGFFTGNTQMVIMPDEKVEIVIPTTSTSTSTGALVVDGGMGVLGNVNVGGNINVANTSTVTANNFFANQKVWSGPVETWLTSKGEVDSGRRIVAVANIAGPAETVQVNLSDDTLAYSEFLAVNDVGNMSSGWISMGINSSTYDDPSFQLTGADDGYMLFEAPVGTTGAGNLIIGTGGEGNINAIVFGAGGFATGNTQMAIFPDDKVQIVIPTVSTSTGTGALVVNGGIGLTGNLNVGGDVNIVGNITLGGSGNTIDVSALAVDDPLIYMGANNAADVLDLGFAGEYIGPGNAATYAGLVRDASDASFRFFGNVQPKPTSTVDFADANLVYPAVWMGSANLQSSTASTGTGSGALVVAGGAGIGGAIYVGGLAAITGNITGGNISSSGVLAATGAISGASLNVSTGNVNGGNLIAATAVSTTEIIKTGSNGVGNIGSSTSVFNTVFAKATSAQYADLAEMYSADADYPAGTVVAFGGVKEVTVSMVENDARVAGVISTNPSYVMNAALEGDHVLPVALQGRVPTRVSGTVRKGDMMVSAGDGAARACAAPQLGTVIGKALEDFDGAEGVIEIVVGRV